MNTQPRAFTEPEHALVRQLLKLAGADTPARLREVPEAQVTEMDDGGMGSLRFVCVPDGDKRVFGSVIGVAIAPDADGTEVHLSLIDDQHDRLYELDAWKVNFSALPRIPRPDQLKLE